MLRTDRILLLDTTTNKIEYLDVEGFDKFGRDYRLILFRPNSSELAVQTLGGLRFYDTAAKGYPQVRWTPIREELVINKAQKTKYLTFF